MTKMALVKKFKPEDYFLAIMFGKSNSPSYHTAVKIARTSNAYFESGEGTGITHLATYVDSYDSIATATALCDIVNKWKNVQVFSKGKLIHGNWKIGSVLRCMTEARRCTDWRAHCQKLIDDPFENFYSHSVGALTISLDTLGDSRSKKNSTPSIVTRWLLPCTYLGSYFRLQKGHPSTPENQLQAIAVREGSDWCPLFRPQDLKEILVKTREL